MSNMNTMNNWEQINESLERVRTSEGWIVRSRGQLIYVPDRLGLWQIQSRLQVMAVLREVPKLDSIITDMVEFEVVDGLAAVLAAEAKGLIIDRVIIELGLASGPEYEQIKARWGLNILLVSSSPSSISRAILEVVGVTSGSK